MEGRGHVDEPGHHTALVGIVHAVETADHIQAVCGAFLSVYHAHEGLVKVHEGGRHGVITPFLGLDLGHIHVVGISDGHHPAALVQFCEVGEIQRRRKVVVVILIDVHGAIAGGIDGLAAAQGNGALAAVPFVGFGNGF